MKHFWRTQELTLTPEVKFTRQTIEAANHAKTQFLALMSHELRIPLTGIISTASMIAEHGLTIEEARELSKIIVSSGNYLLTTINSILDFAKLEADKFEVVHQRVDLHTIIREIITLLDFSAKEKGLKFTAHFPESLPNIISDPRALRHIITNLVSNAIKFTEQGDIDIYIKIIDQKQNTIHLEISVVDTGIGIPHEKLDLIFDRFSQIENVYLRKNSRNGTGIGLSLVKKLTELLGGEIRVDSEVGKGSTFYFSGKFVLSHDKKQQLKKEENEYGYQSKSETAT